MKKKTFDVDIIKKLFYDDKKNMSEISEILNTSRSTILKFFKENNLNSRNGCRTVKIKPTLEQEQILFGCLLGDGYLTKIKSNSCFSYNSSIENHTRLVNDLFLKYSHGVKSRIYLDKRTNKKYTSYYFTTTLNEYFTELRKKWYPNEIKMIPSDLILTNLICLFWYVGDGGLLQNYKKMETSSLKLSTNSFLKKDIDEILLPQLGQFYTYRKDNVIIIPRKSVNKFFDYIGKFPIKEYEHKWNVYPYKNKNGYNSHKHLIDIIINKRKNGEIPYKIAKDLELDSSLVKYYLKKNNLYEPNSENNLLKNWKILSPEGIIYKTNNLINFCKEKGLSHKCLRDVSKNRKKHYRNWICKNEK